VSPAAFLIVILAGQATAPVAQAEGAACAGAGPALAATERALDQREWDDAERALRALPAGREGCGRIVLARARLLAGRGDAAAAEPLFSQAGQLATEDALVHAHFAQFRLSRGQPAQADYLSALALSLDPACPEALVVKAQLAARSGRLREAGEALEKAARAEPTSAEAHYQLGAWLFRGKQRAEAVPHFEKVVALRPRDARALDYLALSLEALGDAEAAESAYRKALAVNDGPFLDSLVDHNYGRFLLKQGRLQESRPHLDRAVGLLPDRRTVYYERARLNLAAKDYAAARQDAERAEGLRDPDGLVLDLQVYYLLATVYARLGESELARKYAELSRTTPIPDQAGDRRQ
jgi:tetratricopeptide (TPR) repeat protein